jgi:hypothetical protein
MGRCGSLKHNFSKVGQLLPSAFLQIGTSAHFVCESAHRHIFFAFCKSAPKFQIFVNNLR